MTTLRRFLYLLLFLALTALTQVGGIALFLSTMIVWAILPNYKLSGVKSLPVHFFAFIAVYAVICQVLVPGLARVFGREALQCTATAHRPYAAVSPVYCLLNRHYVRPQVKALLEQYSKEIAEAYPGTVTGYLDAGFPFLDGFPLPPHLSHDDGLKIDLAYYYEDEAGLYLPLKARSPIGYWAFEAPAPGEADRCSEPARGLTMRWDMDWLQPYWKPYRLDAERTAFMLRWFVEFGRAEGIERIFIEPHLAHRFGVASDLIGFAGCHAARHDDHLHIAVGAPTVDASGQ